MEVWVGAEWGGGAILQEGGEMQGMEPRSIICGWPLEGEQRRKKAGGGGCQELAATTPGFSAPSLSLSCTRPGVNESRSGWRQGAGVGRAEHQDQIAPSSPPAHPEAPPCSQAVPSRLHLLCTRKRLTFKILSEDSFLHSLPFTSPSKKENSR